MRKRFAPAGGAAAAVVCIAAAFLGAADLLGARGADAASPTTKARAAKGSPLPKASAKTRPTARTTVRSTSPSRPPGTTAAGPSAASTAVPVAVAQSAPTVAGRVDPARLSGRLAVAVFGGPTLTSWNTNFGEGFKRAARNVELVIAGEANPSALAFAQKGSPQYDLLLVTGANAASIKASKDTYEPIDPAKLSRAGHVFKDLVVKDSSGQWIGVPVFLTVYGLVVNPQFVRAEQIDSWADMADRAYKGKVLLNSPFFWSTTDITMFSLANGGTTTNLEPAFELLRRVVPNVKATITTLADAAAQIRNEEVDFAPFYFSQYSQLVDQGLKVTWVVPKEGGMSSPLYLVVPKGAKNPANALAFIDFVLQAQQQEAVQEQSSYIPVVDDARLIDKVRDRSGFASAADVLKRTVLPDFDLLAANQQAHIRRVEDLLAK